MTVVIALLLATGLGACAQPGSDQVVAAPAPSPGPSSIYVETGQGTPPAVPTPGPGTPVPTPRPRRTLAADPHVRFAACPTTPAEPGQSNLRPGTDPDVRVDHVLRMELPDGRISGADGATTAFGVAIVPRDEVRVAPGAVAVDVDLAIVRRSGDITPRVAFVEIKVGAGRPVSWTLDQDNSISTDGGDGGFFSSAALPSTDDVGTSRINRFIASHVDAYGKGQCILRFNGAGPQAQAILFDTGIGDGSYPTYVGRDARGVVVSVVNDGGMVPWRDSGLPGRPPVRRH